MSPGRIAISRPAVATVVRGALAALLLPVGARAAAPLAYVADPSDRVTIISRIRKCRASASSIAEPRAVALGSRGRNPPDDPLPPGSAGWQATGAA